MVYCPEYFEIIGNRLLHPIDKGERHHIYPKSCGGSNSESNLVMLTAAEHYRCHELLVDMFQDEPDKRRKMVFAWNMISHTRDGIKLSAEEYAAVRKLHSEEISIALKGKRFTEEHRRKISESLKGHKGCNKGGHRSEKDRKAISDALKRNPPCGMKGKHHSEASKAKIRAALKRNDCDN